MTGNGKSGREGISRRKITLMVTGLIVLVLLLAWFTLSLEPTLPAQTGAVYAHTSTYDMKAPDGETLMIGSTPFLALVDGNVAHVKIGDTVDTMAVGDTKVITEKRAVVKTLGITVFDTNYRIDATYRGVMGGKPDFYLTLRTSSQIPQVLLDRMLPREMVLNPA